MVVFDCSFLYTHLDFFKKILHIYLTAHKQRELQREREKQVQFQDVGIMT